MSKTNTYKVSNEIEFNLPSEIVWDKLEWHEFRDYNGIILPSEESKNYMTNGYLLHGDFFLTTLKKNKNELINKSCKINKKLNGEIRNRYLEVKNKTKNFFQGPFFLSNDFAIAMVFDSADRDGIYAASLYIEISSENNPDYIYYYRIDNELVAINKKYIALLKTFYKIADSISIDGKKVILSASEKELIDEFHRFVDGFRRYSENRVINSLSQDVEKIDGKNVDIDLSILKDLDIKLDLD